MAIAVSIHARVRRATGLLLADDRWLLCFNPRPRTAGDCHVFPFLKWQLCFNPRPRTAGDNMVET